MGVDFELPILAKYKSKIESNSKAKIVVSDESVIEIGDDKYLTYEFLGRTIHTHYTLQIAEFINNDDDDVDHNYNPLQKPLIYWSS